MKRSESYIDKTHIALQSNRGWKNLDRAAQVLLEQHATSEDNAVPLTKIARMCEMDLAHFTRLINNRPGFVRVWEKDYGKTPRSKGVYYLVNPVYTAAHAQGHFYPKSMEKVLASAGPEGLLNTILYEQEKDDIKTVTAKPDPYLSDLMSIAGLSPTSMVNVPVLMDQYIAEHSPSNAYGSVLDQISSLADFMTPTNSLPDKDLDDVLKATARIAWKSVMAYYAVQQIKMGRELK